jgi:hypothetical protein
LGGVSELRLCHGTIRFYFQFSSQFFQRILNVVPLDDAIWYANKTSYLLLELRDLILGDSSWRRCWVWSLLVLLILMLPLQNIIDLIIHKLVVRMSLVIFLIWLDKIYVSSKWEPLWINFILVVKITLVSIRCLHMVVAVHDFALVRWGVLALFISIWRVNHFWFQLGVICELIIVPSFTREASLKHFISLWWNIWLIRTLIRFIQKIFIHTHVNICGYLGFFSNILLRWNLLGCIIRVVNLVMIIPS